MLMLLIYVRYCPTIQPGKKHNENAAMITQTSTAAFRSLIRLDIYFAAGFFASTRFPMWISMALICLLASLKTDKLGNMLTIKGPTKDTI